MKDEFEKLKLEILSTEKTISTQFQRLINIVEIVEKEISTMEVSINTTSERLTSLQKHVQDLEGDLASLQNTNQTLKQESEQKKIENETLERQISDLQSHQSKLNLEISNEEIKLKDLEVEFVSLDSELKDVENKLENAEKLYQDKVETIEKEINEIQYKTKNKGNHYKILRHLLADNYASEPRYNVIKVLKQPGVSTLDQLVLSSGVGKPTVQETLEALNSREIIEFDISSGKFKIIQDFVL